MKSYQKFALPVVIAAPLMALSTQSMAAIAAADLTAPLTAITADANTVFSAVLPVMLTVLGLVIGYKLVKRFVNGI